MDMEQPWGIIRDRRGACSSKLVKSMAKIIKGRQWFYKTITHLLAALFFIPVFIGGHAFADDAPFLVPSIIMLLLDDVSKPEPPPPTPIMIKLNDTGINLCGDYAFGYGGENHSINLDCSFQTDADGDPIPPGQDATFGRDATHNDDSDGYAGFSFSKLDSTGQPLANQSADYTATPWTCVKDNVTGLIWEVRTDDGGLHDQDWTYTWHNPDNTQNGGAAGTANGGNCQGSPCDTTGYVQAVNATGWCGITAWRMPTVIELQSITDLARHEPAIDLRYFPDAGTRWYFWSAEPFANNPGYAWDVYFGDGVDGPESRDTKYHIRLVY